MAKSRDVRVWITGIGLLTPLGADRETSWQALLEGKHGLKALDSTDRPHYGGAVPGVVNRSSHLVMLAAEEAIHDSGLDFTRLDTQRVGVVAGSSKGDLGELGELLKRACSTEDSSSENWLGTWPNAAAAAISQRWNLRGPCLTPIAACATGLIAALRGHALIQSGLCDVVLAGAGDASLDPLVLGAFRRMGVLAKVENDPGRAIRPWDLDRSGFLVGAGAAVLVLERREHALKRDAPPYAEFAGGAFGGDAFHETGLNPDPRGLADLIRRSLVLANTEASSIGHVNVHGTATRSNDPLECRALRLALGPHADQAACSANKPQIGHLLGAAGAAELAFTALAVRDGFVPPTLNLHRPDPACDLDGTPFAARRRPLAAALKLSIGFGGHLAAAVLKRVEERSR